MDSSGLAAALQDGAASLYHNNVTPFIQRCASFVAQQQRWESEPQIQSLASKRDLQHSDSLKWQQDVFHRLVHLFYLSKEGLASEQQFASCKSQALAFLESMHPDGEWPEFTRDKLLFLQDLLYSSCISESEYHASKKPLILRLADQGAILESNDFIFDRNNANDAKIMKSKSIVKTASKGRAKARSLADSDASKTPTRNADTDAADAKARSLASSPLKQVMGAMCRLNRTSSASCNRAMPTNNECKSPMVSQALDSMRLEHCPVREPPSLQNGLLLRTTESPCQNNQEEDALLPSRNDHGDVCNWFTSSPNSPKSILMQEMGDPILEHSSIINNSKSPNGSTPSKLRNVLTGLMLKKTVQAETEKSPNGSQLHSLEISEQRESAVSKGSKWGSGILRFPRKLQFEQEENPKNNSCKIENGISDWQVQPVMGIMLERPSTKSPARKVSSRGAHNFIIDKVLGENIKNELSRIRAEMNEAHPGKTFSNEQIDAIATKLPMDKAELKKLFPQTWCDKYGDIVLDVVQKEFKEHVGEMQKIGRGRDVQYGVPLSPSVCNDENMGVLSPSEHRYQKKHHLPRRNPDLNKCFTALDENSLVNHAESQVSPSFEKGKFRPSMQQGYIKRRTINNNSLDHMPEEEILKMPLCQKNEYTSPFRG